MDLKTEKPTHSDKQPTIKQLIASKPQSKIIRNKGSKVDTQLTTKTDIQKAKLVELWVQTRGHISDMCRSLGIERKTFYNWLKKDKNFNEAIQTAEWGLHDDVRDALIQKIAEGSSTDIQFYLKKRHPDFIDKQANVSVDKVQILVIPSELMGKYGITQGTEDRSTRQS